MRSSMVYPIRFWAVLLVALLAYHFSTDASAEWCKYEKDIDLTLDLSGTDVLAISAVAGNLRVTGVSGSEKAVIKGKACSSKESWLEDIHVETQTGTYAEINAFVSKSNDSGFCIGICYRSLDLEITVPEDLSLDVKDSSGDMLLRNVGAVKVQDSSGDIEIDDARSSISIRDSSGDIEIDRVNGDLTIESDSSGDVYASDITGSVLVEKDSSGDLRFKDISQDVVVERDTSGDIKVTDVGGDFRVLKDGSGSISSSNVIGEVSVPEKD